MDIADWNDALDEMGAAACPSSLWRHWALCPDLTDQGAEHLFHYLFATVLAKRNAICEPTLLQQKK